MSLRQHLELYQGDWMAKKDEINSMFYFRPPVTFSINATEETITGRPVISEFIIANTYLPHPKTGQLMTMVEYYRTMLGYNIKYTDDYAIFFDSEKGIYYPPECIYIDDLDECSPERPSIFTFVL